MDSEGQQPVQTPVEPAAPPAAEPSVELAVEPSVEESAGEVGGGEVVEPQSTDVPAIESEEAPVAAASQPALKRWLSLAQDRGRIGVARFRGLDRRIQAGVGAALVLVLLASGALVFAVAPRGGGAQPSAGTSPSDIAVSPSGSSFSPVASPTSSASPGPTIEPWTMPPNTSGNRIAVGFGHVCFILTTGKVKCWGRNDDGQLGTESAEDSLVPATVVGVANARSIVAGYADNSAVTCALIADGSIECWGGGTTAAGPNGIQGIGQVTRLFSGATAGCYYLSEGKLGSCELGPDDLAMEMEGASAVATTSESTCLLVKGAMKCKASVPDGEEFTGTIRGITGATAIAAGTDETCAIVAKGAVKCWGMNQLESAAAPKAYTINGITGARAIALGEVFGCAIVAKGGVKCWGSNDSGQLGLGHAEQANPGIDYYRGYTVKGISGATAIGAGGTTACVALSGDDIRCWGLNDNGQLGDGTTVTCSSPVGVTGLSKASSTCKTPYDPNATPTPRPTPSPSPSPSPTPTAGPTVTPTPAPTPTPEATPTPREAPTETPAS